MRAQVRGGEWPSVKSKKGQERGRDTGEPSSAGEARAEGLRERC